MARHYTRVHQTKRDDTAAAVASHGKEFSRRDRMIAQAYADGRSVKRIARDFGLSVARIGQIIRAMREGT